MQIICEVYGLAGENFVTFSLRRSRYIAQRFLAFEDYRKD